MCQSIADGGKRCFSHTYPTALEAKRRMKSAKESGDRTELLEAQKDWLTTEEGIEHLDSQGKDELADKFRSRRDARIRKYNASTGSNHALTSRRGTKSSGTSTRKKPIWNKQGIHRKTGTRFNENGWSQEKTHELTGTSYDPTGFDINGKDSEGFNKSGYINGYDREGFDERGRDSGGYTKTGHHYLTNLDRTGFDPDGYNKRGFHRDSGRHYSQDEQDEALNHSL